jgi:hypothetical protein
MSAEATNWVWKHSEAAGSDRLVLLALADFCNEKAECYASYGTLVKKTRLGEKTVYRSLKSLQDMGEIEQLKQGGFANGGKVSSEWKLPRCQSDVDVKLTSTRCQIDIPTIHNNTDSNSSSPPARPKPPQLTVVKQSNSHPSGKTEKTSQPKREDVLGKGLTDEEWLNRLAVQHAHIDIPALFDRCLVWCRERGKIASRRQFMAFVRNAKPERPMQIAKPQPAGQSAWDRELAEIRKAVGE